jgi:quercetin dioxygenase-like cupin family protein
MNRYRLDEMVKGWFVGGFTPTVVSTGACEVAVKHYKAGDSEGEHFHKIATEVTVVLSGRVRMADQEFGDGDIVEIEPGVATAFEALTDVTTVVVKIPGAADDKYTV